MKNNYMNIKMAANLLSAFYIQNDLPVYAVKLQTLDIHNQKDFEFAKKNIREVAEVFNKALEEIEELERLEY